MKVRVNCMYDHCRPLYGTRDGSYLHQKPKLVTKLIAIFSDILDLKRFKVAEMTFKVTQGD